MRDAILTALTNLIKIKSLVTLATTAAFVVLALRGDIAPDQFLTIFTMIVGFYFGTQKIKEVESVKEEEPASDEWHEN